MGVYSGEKQPADVREFLADTIEEVGKTQKTKFSSTVHKTSNKFSWRQLPIAIPLGPSSKIRSRTPVTIAGKMHTLGREPQT